MSNSLIVQARLICSYIGRDPEEVLDVVLSDTKPWCATILFSDDTAQDFVISHIENDKGV